jgi:acyl transferase domain-containing protein/NAD(P)H-dependent flavin oxidoreductase YrpB (nitropropane dioxygenase family)/NAD(P)-dependent dehydrogenase (short-subunit alcohol dehydrogenase family)
VFSAVQRFGHKFSFIVITPGGLSDPSIAVAATRAGCPGILDFEYATDLEISKRTIEATDQRARGPYGVKVNAGDEAFISTLMKGLPRDLAIVILTGGAHDNLGELIHELRSQNRSVLLEVMSLEQAFLGETLGVHGIIAKGNEAAGIVGEKTTFILLQQILSKTALPVFAQGGIGLHTAAACCAAGASGVILDTQFLLCREAPLTTEVRHFISRMDGSEPRLFSGESGVECRVYLRPDSPILEDFRGVQNAAAEGLKAERAYREIIRKNLSWTTLENPLWPAGQDIVFAGELAAKYRTVGSIINAMRRAVNDHIKTAKAHLSIESNSPLAQSHGTLFPIVQGPMARITDVPAFASRVACEGALPVVALSTLREAEIKSLLQKVKNELGDRPWGIGILGFIQEDQLREQLDAATPFAPPFAIIAGGQPGQVSLLESMGITAYAHVPSPSVLDMFIESGAKRFIFEGRECGGHIGPRSGFVLWETMTERLIEKLKNSDDPEKYHILYAGGINDAVSSVMVAVLSAPLARLGARIGMVMGTAYLLTSDIVESGAILPDYQKKVLDCSRTSVLEFSPGHALRCCDTPLARKFVAKRRELTERKASRKEMADCLEKLTVGKARIAAKGLARKGVCGQKGDKGPLVSVDCTHQHEEGLYMVGQLAALHERITTIHELHENVTARASEMLASLIPYEAGKESGKAGPADIAIIGMACLFPKAGDIRTYWENILNKTNAITEIPAHRWDWRLYYDKDRNARDKIYSRWGGFLDDLAFEPTRYGLPPKSVESIDPMQLMALEVARRALADAGYEERPFERETTSVILGISGSGDVGVQYGVRAEMPRFSGRLPEEVAKRLPEWTEDTFAGILVNVISGRIANRLNFGGVNYTADAACASSLAAVYQGVGELVSGRSSLVITGGVDTVQGPFSYMCFSKTQALSPRGQCSTFDESADGIVISEGIAMVALKRLEDAERDGDRIYAVIKGAGASSDGRAKGLTAPLPEGQLAAMRRAYAQAGFSPESVDLFEAHGTGTVVGDITELESTARLLKEAGAGSRQSAIGSVKSLIGHTKAAAGIAGLIKATLSLHNRVLPPHAWVNRPNRKFEDPEIPLYLPDQAQPWLSSQGHPRRAGVSAFGFGGTNFHVVLEEHDGGYRLQSQTEPAGRWPAELFLWHGNGSDELTTAMMSTKRELQNEGKTDLTGLASRLAVSYKTGKETIAIVAARIDELSGKIDSALGYLTGKNSSLPKGVYRGSGVYEGKTALLFPGQGSQYAGMFREVAVHFPVYADVLSEADRFLGERFASRFDGARLSNFIFPRGCYDDEARAAAEKTLTGTDVAQPSLGASEASLLALMKTFGLKADMAGGHSYGEFTALFAAGAIDFSALISLSEARGRFIVDAVRDSKGELGTMAAVKASREYVDKAIRDVHDLIVANHNGPKQCVISGSEEAIELASRIMMQDGVTVVKIPVAAAFHSRFVEPAKAALAELITETVWRNPAIPVYSNTTGEPHANDPVRIGQVMTDHLVRPVEFVAQIEAMYRDGARVFLELGPKSVLTRLVGSILRGRPHRTIAIDDNGGGVAGMLHAFGQLLCAGVCLDPCKLYREREVDESVAESIPADPKRIWMLNGSRARRASEPVKQAGVTVLEMQSGRTDLESVETNHIQLPANDSFQRRLAARKYSKGGRVKMSNDEKPFMSSYFEMMRQFLETQERVMQMYITGESNGRQTTERPARQMRVRDFREDRQTIIQPTSQEGELFQPELPGNGKRQNWGQGMQTAQPKPLKTPEADSVQPEKPSSFKPERNSSGKTDAGQEIDREKVSSILLGIVEEKTGYPPDMVGLTQNLEADLGIDSIKRVEIVGALMKALPPVYGQILGKNLGGLNTQSTLSEMLDILEKVKTGEGSPLPFDQAGAGATARPESRPFRHVMKQMQEPVDTLASRRFRPGHFLLTRDSLNVADKLAGLLSERGCAVTIIERDIIQDEELLNQWCLTEMKDVDSIEGIVHLAQIGTGWLPGQSSIQTWRDLLQLNEKAFFALLHHFSGKLSRNAHIMSASSLGGLFSRGEEKPTGLSLQGGFVGLLKSLSEERQSLRVKAVDADPEQTGDKIAVSLMNELELEGGRQEVGYPRGNRTIFQTVPAPIKQEGELPSGVRDLVVLATGGMKGVTAELLREFALPGNTLIVTGRTPLTEEDPEDLKPFRTSSELREHFVSEVRNKRLKMAPAEIRRKIRTVLGSREMRSNLEDFRARGATVEYHAIDVTNEDSLSMLIEDIYGRYSRISGVVHGAGIIEDKLLADKTSESWSRVVETKVIGLLLLQKYLRPKSLRFFAVMSSVAGRYGNSGQTDYSTANELMNRLCCQLKLEWENKVTVKAFCWGPWGPTTFGAGMVTPEIESKFAEKKISLVRSDPARLVFRSDLTCAANTDIEIICGEGPWEEREAVIGRIKKMSESGNSAPEQTREGEVGNGDFRSSIAGSQSCYK